MGCACFFPTYENGALLSAGRHCHRLPVFVFRQITLCPRACAVGGCSEIARGHTYKQASPYTIVPFVSRGGSAFDFLLSLFQRTNNAAAKIKHFDPAAFDFGKKKAFPMRPGHFFASCEKAMTDLDWAPEYNTVDGLRDSYENDFVHKKVGGRGAIY